MNINIILLINYFTTEDNFIKTKLKEDFIKEKAKIRKIVKDKR